MTNKQVGQILYILSRADMNLVPVMIVEEIIKRTLEGEQVSYIVEAMGKSGAKKKFTLDFNSSIVFEDIGSAKDYLVKNATDAIGVLCAEAYDRSNLLLESSLKNKEQQQFSANVQESSVQEYDEVLLDDGTRVKIHR